MEPDRGDIDRTYGWGHQHRQSTVDIEPRPREHDVFARRSACAYTQARTLPLVACHSLDRRAGALHGLQRVPRPLQRTAALVRRKVAGGRGWREVSDTD